MIPPIFLCLLHRGQLCCRKTPLPDTLLCRMRIFALSGVDQKHARIVPFQIALVQLFQRFKLCSECREHGFRKRHWAVFSALTIRHGEDPRFNINTRHAERHTCRNPSPAAIPQLHHQIIRRQHMLQNRLNLLTGSDHRNVGCSLRPDDPFYLAKFLVPHMSIKK
jgi:hypothetical protein